MGEDQNWLLDLKNHLERMRSKWDSLAQKLTQDRQGQNCAMADYGWIFPDEDILSAPKMTTMHAHDPGFKWANHKLSERNPPVHNACPFLLLGGMGYQ